MWPKDSYSAINALLAKSNAAAQKKNWWLKWQVNRWILPISMADHNRRYQLLNDQISWSQDAVDNFKRTLESRHDRYCNEYRSELHRRFEEHFKKRDVTRLRHAKQCILEVERAALAANYPKSKVKTLCDDFFTKDIPTKTMDEMVQMIVTFLSKQ